MPQKPDHQGWQRAVEAELRVGEVIVIGPLAGIAPNPDPGSAYGAAFAFPLMWLMRAAARRRARRSVTGRTGMPMARRMVVAVTDQRIVIWSANRRWALGELLGDLANDRIVGAEAPTVGAGWRRVNVRFVDGQSATLKVASKNADPLAAALSRP